MSVPSSLEFRILAGAGSGCRLPLKAGTYRAGGDDRCDILLPDAGLAEVAFVLYVGEHEVALEAVDRAVTLRGNAVRGLAPLAAGQVFMLDDSLFAVDDAGAPWPEDPVALAAGQAGPPPVANGDEPQADAPDAGGMAANAATLASSLHEDAPSDPPPGLAADSTVAGPPPARQRVHRESARRLDDAEENLGQAWTDAVAILGHPYKPEVLLQRAAAIADASAEFEKKLELLGPGPVVAEPGKPTPATHSREIAEKALASIPAAGHAGLYAMLDQGTLSIFVEKLRKSAMVARTQGYGEVALRADRTIDLLALIRKHVQQPEPQGGVTQAFTKLISTVRRASFQDAGLSGSSSLQSSSRMSSLAEIARINQALHEVSNEIFRLSIVDDTVTSNASTNSGVFNETITAKMTRTVERALSDGEKEMELLDGTALPAQYVKDARRDHHDVAGGVHYYLPQGERLLADDIDPTDGAQLAQRTVAGFNRLADFYDGNAELAQVVLMYAHQGVAGALLGPLFDDESNNPIKLGDMPGLLLDDGRPGAQRTGLQFYKTAAGGAGIDFTYEVRGGRFLQPVTYMDARNEPEHQVFLDPEHSVAHIQFRVELVEDNSTNTKGAAARRLQDRVSLSLTAPPRYSYNLVPGDFQRPYAAKDDLKDFVPSPDDSDYESSAKSLMRQDLESFAENRQLMSELQAWTATWKNPDTPPLARLEHIYGLVLEPALRGHAGTGERSVAAGDDTPGRPDETAGYPDEAGAQASSARFDELATEVKLRLDNIGATILDAFQPIGVLLARHGEDMRLAYDTGRSSARRSTTENGVPPNLRESGSNSLAQGTPRSGGADAYRAFLDNEAAPYTRLTGQSAALQDHPTFAHAQSLYGSLVDYVGQAGQQGEHAAIPPFPAGVGQELARLRSTLLALADDPGSAGLLKRLAALLAEPLAGLPAEMNEHIRQNNWAGLLEGAVVLGLYKEPPKNGESKKKN